MPAIVERIATALCDCEITSAVVIDDSIQVSERATLELPVWLEILEVLSVAHAESIERLRIAFENAGHARLEIEPPTEMLEAIRTIIAESNVQNAKELLKERKSTEAEVNSILDFLSELPIEVATYPSPADAPIDAPLILVDYTINEDAENAGTAATAYLKRVTEEADRIGRVPAVILMSRNSPEREDWEDVPDAAAFLRFCFRYRDKPVLAASKNVFYFHLEELLESWPLGQTYRSQVSDLRRMLTESIEVVTRQLTRLTPTDFCSFAEYRLGDGNESKCADHLRFLISRMMQAELRKSEVSQSLHGFARTLITSNLRNNDEQSVALHDLQGNILYDLSDSAKAAPLSFGDIFSQQSGDERRYLLVLTPECDLEIRSGGQPKAENVLLLEGQCVDRPTQDDFKECTPLMREHSNAPCQWLSWNLRRPVAIYRDSLAAGAGDRPVKWGRMNYEHAEKLQQRFASDLLEVGTEEFLEGTWRHSVTVLGGQNGDQLKGTVTVVEMRMVDARLWALSGDADVLFRETGREVLPLDVVRELQVFMPVNTFLEKCKQKQVFVAIKEKKFALVWRRSGTLGGWTGPTDWHGSAPFTG